MTRTEQYLEEAQSFLDYNEDAGPLAHLSVLRDMALVRLQLDQLEQLKNLRDEIRALKIEEMRDIRNILQEGLFQYQQREKK